MSSLKIIRDQLNITQNTSLNIVSDGKTIHIHPIKGVTTTSELDNGTLYAVLKRTQGAWANEDWGTYDKEEKKRRKAEILAVKRNKKDFVNIKNLQLAD